jgi:hypothetical protein
MVQRTHQQEQLHAHHQPRRASAVKPQEDKLMITGDTVWVVKGCPVTQAQVDDGVWPESALGCTEWQFSDGLPGARTVSEDYINLEVGLRRYTGYRFVWVS